MNKLNVIGVDLASASSPSFWVASVPVWLPLKHALRHITGLESRNGTATR
jgi:hypothetical protein